MENGIFKLDWASVGDAVLTAAVTAVLIGLVSIVSTSGFSVFTTDWVMVGKNMVDWFTVAGIISLGHSLLSTNSGSLLGVGPAN